MSEKDIGDLERGVNPAVGPNWLLLKNSIRRDNRFLIYLFLFNFI